MPDGDQFEPSEPHLTEYDPIEDMVKASGFGIAWSRWEAIKLIAEAMASLEDNEITREVTNGFADLLYAVPNHFEWDYSLMAEPEN